LGDDGKRAALNEKDVLLLNNRIQENGKDGWSEDLIRARTEDLISMILDIWKVPQGHVSKVQRERNESSKRVQIIDLISAGLIEPGQKIYPHSKKYEGIFACVLADGRIELNGNFYDSLSGAGVSVRGSSTNGWWFFAIGSPSGVRLSELYKTYLALSGEENSDESDEEEVDED
jgi:hypothetical protein